MVSNLQIYGLEVSVLTSGSRTSHISATFSSTHPCILFQSRCFPASFVCLGAGFSVGLAAGLHNRYGLWRWGMKDHTTPQTLCQHGTRSSYPFFLPRIKSHLCWLPHVYSLTLDSDSNFCRRLHLYGLIVALSILNKSQRDEGFCTSIFFRPPMPFNGTRLKSRWT